MAPPQTCWCMTCKKCYAREWARARHRAKAYGTWDPRRDPDRARQHLKALQAEGVGVHAAAAAAGIGRSRIVEIRSGRATWITPDTEARILAITGSARRRLPVHGVMRRMQALNAIGYPTREIGEMVGLTQRDVTRYMTGRSSWVTRATFDRVAAAYDAHHLKARGNPQSLASARRRGYAPPLAWDDIDDLNEIPTGFRGTTIRPARADELRELDERLAGVSEVCRSLGIERNTLNRWCARNGMSDLYARLAARETWSAEEARSA